MVFHMACCCQWLPEGEALGLGRGLLEPGFHVGNLVISWGLRIEDFWKVFVGYNSPFME